MTTGYEWNVQDLEFTREYLWTPEFWPTLIKLLEVEPGKIIADVGCGTGYTARRIAKELNKKGKVIGIDLNERFIEYAKKLAEEEGLSEAIEFRVGDVYNLEHMLYGYKPDLTYCQSLLVNLPDQKIVEQMTKITKVGGVVSCIEPGSLKYFKAYCPVDKRLAELEEKLAVIETGGKTKTEKECEGAFTKTFKGDFNIYSKIPCMFKDAGLSNVQVYEYIFAEPFSDPNIVEREFKKMGVKYPIHRYTSQEIVRYLKGKIDMSRRHFEQDKKMFLETNIPEEVIDEWHKRRVKIWKNLMKSPSKIKNSGIFYSDSLVIVTGKKSLNTFNYKIKQ